MAISLFLFSYFYFILLITLLYHDMDVLYGILSFRPSNP